MQRRSLLLASLASCAAGRARAQSDHARNAVPLYGTADAMQGLYRQRLQPRAAAFADAAEALVAPLQASCAAGAPATSRDGARHAWREALAAWQALATVPLGPLIQRRALRELDFQPARPALIERMVARAPRGAAALRQVGTPAKGLPALEWLLWSQPAAAGSPACAYAVEVAADLAREARALAGAVAESAAEEWEPERGDAAFAELLNQWVGAVERLRWAQIDKPRREAASRGRPPEYPRTASGQTAAAWARQWQVLAELAVFGGGELPVPGQGPVALETFLRGHGHNPLADRWRAQVERTGQAVQGLAPNSPRAVLDRAVAELAAVKRLAEAELAPALHVHMGFSDADGD